MMCYNNLLCCESTGDGGGTVRRVSEQSRNWQKNAKEKNEKKTTRKERRQWTMHMHSYIRGIEGV